MVIFLSGSGNIAFLHHMEVETDMETELKRIQSLLLDRISSAVSKRDVAEVAALSGLARECEALQVEIASINRRIEAAKRALNGSSSSSVNSEDLTYSAETPTTSAKTAGAEARNSWIVAVQAQGITLYGHKKRYQSALGQSVAVAFANELPNFENRWFLGLTDEPTDVAVLLCKSRAGKLHDIVLPVSHLPEIWRVLSRSKNQVKFNIRTDAGRRFSLLVPGNDPLDVTRYISNYEPLR
ncbi:MAG: hypothetical protein M1541_10425 [Acidobacteria bacterium]|nr:hypothetical protein [Acidobacteriota bacterium]